MNIKFKHWNEAGMTQYISHPSRIEERWIRSALTTPAGEVPVIKTDLEFHDKWGFIKMRLGIGRMRYTVPPGLYGTGNPGTGSPVFVTANYKLTFDMLRRDLNTVDAWILVLDTKGINVWCAAGKGTFGTHELNNRIREVRLHLLVRHRDLIVPQLGAVGVAAHEVKKSTGFNVHYGPVYSKDIKTYLNSGRRSSPDMRLVHFHLSDRIAVAPLEFIPAMKYYPWLLLYFIFRILILHKPWMPALLMDGAGLLGAVLTGSILVPILLPWIPGRAFSVKGAISGFIFAMLWNWFTQPTVTEGVANVLLFTPIAAFLAMNFTGASTYTNMTGVYKEMRFSLPWMISAVCIGLILIWF